MQGKPSVRACRRATQVSFGVRLMKNILLVAIIFSVSLTFGCFDGIYQFMPFDRTDMMGTWTLDSDSEVLVYQFSQKGNTISVTIGTINGPLAGPVWSWKLIDDETLEIATEENTTTTYKKLGYTVDSIRVLDQDRKQMIFKRKAQPNKAL